MSDMGIYEHIPIPIGDDDPRLANDIGSDTYIGLSTNEYGTPISKHICNQCGGEFTVCPPSHYENNAGCGSTSCTSYDPRRDADILFDMGKVRRTT